MIQLLGWMAARPGFDACSGRCPRHAAMRGIVPDAVKTEPSFTTLFAEYNKYLLRRLSVWLDV